MVPASMRRQRRQRVTEVIFMMHGLVIKDFLRRVTGRKASMMENSIAILKQRSATENPGLAGERTIDVETNSTPRREANSGEQDTVNLGQEPTIKKVILVGEPAERVGMARTSRPDGSSRSVVSSSDSQVAAEAESYAKERFQQLQERSAEFSRAVLAASAIQAFWMSHKRRRQSQNHASSDVR